MLSGQGGRVGEGAVVARWIGMREGERTYCHHHHQVVRLLGHAIVLLLCHCVWRGGRQVG